MKPVLETFTCAAMVEGATIGADDDGADDDGADDVTAYDDGANDDGTHDDGTHDDGADDRADSAATKDVAADNAFVDGGDFASVAATAAAVAT